MQALLICMIEVAISPSSNTSDLSSPGPSSTHLPHLQGPITPGSLLSSQPSHMLFPHTSNTRYNLKKMFHPHVHLTAALHKKWTHACSFAFGQTDSLLAFHSHVPRFSSRSCPLYPQAEARSSPTHLPVGVHSLQPTASWDPCSPPLSPLDWGHCVHLCLPML